MPITFDDDGYVKVSSFVDSAEHVSDKPLYERLYDNL